MKWDAPREPHLDRQSRTGSEVFRSRSFALDIRGQSALHRAPQMGDLDVPARGRSLHHKRPSAPSIISISCRLAIHDPAASAEKG